MEQRKIKRFGWKPDLPDMRDLKLGLGVPTGPLPDHVDLRQNPAIPHKVYDQGDLGSCTANAIAGLFEFAQRREHPRWDWMPSRLFVYYEERVIEGTVGEDSGAYIRDGFKVINNLGIPPESTCKYDIARFKRKPSSTAYRAAGNHQVLEYQRVDRNIPLMRQLLADGVPFVFGFSVYESFTSATVSSTGVMTMPTSNESLLGGHAIMCVGYDHPAGRFILRNSWGPNWGDKGYFYMPYDYVANPDLSDDFWAITAIEVNPASMR